MKAMFLQPPPCGFYPFELASFPDQQAESYSRPTSPPSPTSQPPGPVLSAIGILLLSATAPCAPGSSLPSPHTHLMSLKCIPSCCIYTLRDMVPASSWGHLSPIPDTCSPWSLLRYAGLPLGPVALQRTGWNSPPLTSGPSTSPFSTIPVPNHQARWGALTLKLPAHSPTGPIRGYLAGESPKGRAALHFPTPVPASGRQ